MSSREAISSVGSGAPKVAAKPSVMIEKSAASAAAKY
jgi:hypothetical protein